MNWGLIWCAFFGLQVAACLLTLAMGLKIAASRKRVGGGGCN